jgi:uncharacterized protein YdaU (DUF1376 family)
VNFYKHHIGDYAQATAHLSFVEDAAYSRLIRKYYADEKPLPADLKAVQRLVGARSRDEKEAVASVLEEFFTLEADGWHNKRCDSELAKANAQAETNRRIAEEREARRRERTQHASLHDSSHEPSHDSLAVREPSQTPDTRHQTPDSISPSGINTPSSGAYSPSPVGDEPEPPPDPIEPDAPKVPACPHLAVLKLWAEVLPNLPQHDPDHWHDVRRKHLQTRWRETAAAKGWKSQDDGLAFFRKLFAYVGKSAFLTGRGKQADPSRPPFVIELEWLILPTNWAKVIEGKYHQEA